MRHIDSLRKNEEFHRVFSHHRSVADQNIVMYKAPGTGRLGIVCSKKVGNSVVRHTFARLVREAYRLNQSSIQKDWDIIVVARESAKGQGFTAIEQSFITLLKRLSIFMENEELK